MPKRQTETKIWSTQRWYRKLHPYHKLVWKYLTDCCDHAGIWKIDYGQLVEDTGIEDFNLAQFVEACNGDFDKETGERIFRERIMIVNKGILWITGFVKFQYENKDFLVNPEVPAIKSALHILNGYRILQQALDKGYITLSKPFGTLPKPSATHLKEVQPDNIENNDAIGTLSTAIMPENGAKAPFEGMTNPSQPLYNPSEREEVGTIRTKDIIHNTPPLVSNSKTEEGEEEKGSPQESKRDVQGVYGEADVGLIWDVERELLADQKRFEAIAMSTQKTEQVARDSLHKYHLHLQEKVIYPKPRNALFAGYEKWLLNEKNFTKNAIVHQPGSPNGKSAGAVELAAKLASKVAARGNADHSG